MKDLVESTEKEQAAIKTKESKGGKAKKTHTAAKTLAPAQ